jgi:UDP-glucose 4-epimerase
MRVLLTGSTGYIGSHLLCYLREQGLNVFGVTRRDGFDLSVPGWTTALPETTFDAVVHLAQSHRHRDFPEGARDMVAVNVMSTAELLTWAARKSVGRFLLASSGNVYAYGSEPFQEDHPCAPGSMYAATKLAAEHLSIPYDGLLTLTIARIFGVFGAGQRDRLFPALRERLCAGRPITLASGIGGLLTPIHIHDTVRALHALLTAENDRGFHTVNVAGDERISVRQIAESMGTASGMKPVFEETAEAPFWLCADTRRLSRFYTPSVSIREGIADVMAAVHGIENAHEHAP